MPIGNLWMTAVAAAVRCFLFAVFTIAGIAKLRERGKTQETLLAFGMPASAVRTLAVLLPLSELGVAAALPFSRWAGVAAILLLAMFTAAVGLNLARNRPVQCNCFGAISASRISWRTMLRNACLMAAAFVCVASSPSDELAYTAQAIRASSGYAGLVAILLSATTAFTCVWLFSSVLHQNGRLLVRIEQLEMQVAARRSPPVAAAGPAVEAIGLPVGVAAPDFDLPTLAGGRARLSDLTSEKPVLLIFVNPECGPCQLLIPEIAGWQKKADAHFTTVVVSRGSVDVNDAKFGSCDRRWIVIQPDDELNNQYRAVATPAAVLINRGGRIAQPMGVGLDPIRRLVRTAGGALIAPPDIESHTERTLDVARLSETRVRDLRGATTTVNEHATGDTVMVFWDPACGFCKELLQPLRETEARLGTALNMLIISRGSLEKNTALGFSATILVDDSFSVGRAVEVRGTPAALTVNLRTGDRSAAALGAKEVLQLVERSVTSAPTRSHDAKTAAPA